MLTRLKFWLECSRWYALPMSFFSWLVIFVYGLDEDGNPLYGLLALVGICFAHLAANLFDDYIDYHNLQKNIDENNKITLPNTQQGKCKYLLDGKAGLSDVLKIIILYCFIALLIGIFFYFTAGKGVLIFMGLGAVLVLLYPFMSNIRLSEFAVAMCYGPLLFGGTYYVMTGQFALEAFILSIPTMIFTVNLIYTDTFMDRDIDKKEGKKTLCGAFKTLFSALNFQKLLLLAGYLSVFIVGIFDIADWEIFLTYLTIPLAIDLINSIDLYIEHPDKVPEKKWYHFPFENWQEIKENNSAAFMFRMYQARNLMIYFSVLLAISVYFD